MLQAVVMWVFQGLTRVVLAGLVLEFYLAGAALFGVTTFQPHKALGQALALAILLLLALALVARLGRRVVGLTVLLAALTVVQVLLPRAAHTLPWVAALHVANAVAVGMVTFGIVRALPASRSPDALAAVGPGTHG